MTGRRQIADSPTQLWLIFAIHASLVGFAALALHSRGFADVSDVYPAWVSQWTSGGPLVGLQRDWVYPVGALVPILLPALAGSGYLAAWLVLVLGLDAWAFALLVRRSGPAALFWIVLLLALGPAASGRLDAVVMPLSTVGVLWLADRPGTASALLTAAAWIKVWPAAVVIAAIAAARRRVAVLGPALITTAAVIAVDLVLGGAAHLFSFLTQQGGRGLQIEAPLATAWLWLGALGALPVGTVFDARMLDYEITAPGADVAGAVVTPVMLLLAAALAVLGLLSVRSGSSWERLFPGLALALVATFLVVNKVGSTQYALWLAPAIALGTVLRPRQYRFPAAVAIACAVLAQLVLLGPIYTALLHLSPGAVLLVTLRNLGYLMILGWALVDLTSSLRRHATPPPVPVPRREPRAVER